MAKMWPRRLSNDILGDYLRSAEVKVYRRLERDLDDEFTVFYSRPWLGQKPTGEEIDGECDFVVAHPVKGVLALEVKGGSIAYDSATDLWTSRDRWGYTHEIKNPVRQARDSKYQLLDKLRKSRAWSSRRIPIGHGVVFPDVERPDGDLGADMPLELFCFLDDFEFGLAEWIADRFNVAGKTDHDPRSLGADGLEALEEILARPFHLKAPLGRHLGECDRELATLTEQQYHILQMIEDIPRVIVSGGAGTGKTVLAVEEAVRRANSGARVLFICFNRPLAEDIRRKTGSAFNITVASFHEFCHREARRARIPLPEGDALDQKVYDEVYPQALIDALSRKPDRRFDCIIVDEGQDFLPLWFDALIAALDDKTNGIVRIFLDSNQRVYGNRVSVPSDFASSPIRLPSNLRNTRRIHDVVQRHYNGTPVRATGPEGVSVEWMGVASVEEARGTVADRVRTLVEKERVNPDDISVLVTATRMIPAIAPAGKVGNLKTKRCDAAPDGSAVTVDSVRRFKGLESPVVVLSLTLDMVETEEIEEMLYVALSRARTHLIVVGTEADLLRARGS